MKPSVYITRLIPGPGIGLLEEGFEVEVFGEDRNLTREEFLAAVPGRGALLTMLNNTVDAEVMDAAGPGLKIIANYAVGYNNIDVNAATARGIAVTNTPGVLTETTADLAWALLMSGARRVVEGDRYTREGKFVGWEPMLFLGGDIHHKTLGIVGMGRIGQAMARRALGFEMPVLYTSRRPLEPEIERALNARWVPLDTLLAEADFISLHVPLTPGTRHLISADALSRMKPTAYLINTARGPIVDEKALVEALRERRIAGAGLDVYEDEPSLAPGLAELDNVVILPHIGSGSIETRTKMAQMAAANIVAFFRGEPPPNLLNAEVLRA